MKNLQRAEPSEILPRVGVERRLTLNSAEVLQPSRQGTRKVRDVAGLGRMLESYDLVTRIHDDDFTIDNSQLGAAEAAAMIASTFGLEPVG